MRLSHLHLPTLISYAPQPASPRIPPDKTLRLQHPGSRTPRNRCSYLRIFSMTDAQQSRISGVSGRDDDFQPQANGSPKSEQRARVAQNSIDIVAEPSSVSNETCSHHSSGGENGSVANKSAEKAQLLTVQTREVDDGSDIIPSRRLWAPVRLKKPTLFTMLTLFTIL